MDDAVLPANAEPFPRVADEHVPTADRLDGSGTGAAATEIGLVCARYFDEGAASECFSHLIRARYHPHTLSRLFLQILTSCVLSICANLCKLHAVELFGIMIRPVFPVNQSCTARHATDSCARPVDVALLGAHLMPGPQSSQDAATPHPYAAYPLWVTKRSYAAAGRHRVRLGSGRTDASQPPVAN